VGRGYVGAAQALATAMVVAFFLADAGYGTMSRETFSICEDILARCIKTGRATDEWYFDDRGYQIFSALLKLHDRQLRKAPFSALLRANDRFKSFVKSKARRNNACLQAISARAKEAGNALRSPETHHEAWPLATARSKWCARWVLAGNNSTKSAANGDPIDG
jgi:hypothetical protein